MKRNAILLALAVVCAFAVTFARGAAAQAEQPADIAGNWNATIHAPDKTMNEVWTIKEEGSKITGTVKNAKGELPLTGTITGKIFRGLVKDGEQNYQVHLTLDGNDLDGTIRMGRNEFLIMMRKAR